MTARRFTFKKQPEATGLARVASPYPRTDVKLDGKVVGSIDPPNWRTQDQKWSVHLMVMKGTGLPDDGNKNCPWITLKLKARFDSEPEAREWLGTHAATIIAKYTFHHLED